MKKVMLVISILAATGAVAGFALAQGRGGSARMAAGGQMGQPGPGMRPGGPDGPGGNRGPMLMVEPSEQGVFVLQGGLLLKFDAGTLKQVGQIELGTPPAAGSGPGDQGDRPPMPPPAGVMRVQDGNVIVVLGDQFVVVNAASFKVVVKSTIPALPAPPTQPDDAVDDGGPMPPPMPPMGPQAALLKAVGKTAYLQRGPELLAVSIADGHVIAAGALPLPPRPGAGN